VNVQRIIKGCVRSWLELAGLPDRCGAGSVEVANCAYGVEAIFESCKGRGLWEEHEKTVEAFVEVREAFGLEELEAEVWHFIVSMNMRQIAETRTGEYIHVKTGDSRSWTSLSI
jgi:hypothetical protein